MRRPPTWAEDAAQEEACYIHPLTRTEVVLATGGSEGMPARVPAAELPGGPHIDMRRPTDGRFRGTLLPGDLIVVSLEQGAQVDLRAAGEHAS
eukprot:9279976-Lingulodinium_polyedra.AAC.1